jgi:hypothetical protein
VQESSITDAKPAYTLTVVLAVSACAVKASEAATTAAQQLIFVNLFILRCPIFITVMTLISISKEPQ